ncbi:MAG: 50S ribosomal protein L22 [Candidatus Firestonebacteria bacterium]
MEISAEANFVRMPPRKLRIIADLIRGKRITEAFNILRFVPKAGTVILEKILKTAVSNAVTNNKLKEDTLYISWLTVDSGPSLKRFMPRAMGRAAMIKKRMSHVTIKLKEKE